AIEQSLVHARRAGRLITGSFLLAVPLVAGPIPAEEALARLDFFIGGQPHPGDLQMRSVLLAMLRQIAEAWAGGRAADEQMRELGIHAGDIWLAELALIAGDLRTAADYLRLGCEEMESRGATAELSTYAPHLGRVLCMLGDVDEAEHLAQKGRELG